MVDKLFAGLAPDPTARLLDPGCGPGAFIEGVLHWCSARGYEPPHIVGVESDPNHVAIARRKFRGQQKVQVRNADFLLKDQDESFDYIIGNPPYVSITGLREDERTAYRKRYSSATNRFDLYGLFFERALELLNPLGKLVFITPEKFLYVESAAALRSILLRRKVSELHFLAEDTFGDFVTYPLVTTIGGGGSGAPRILLRSGEERRISLPLDGSSWLPAVMNAEERGGPTLGDIALRVSCGVATGSDKVFVIPNDQLDPPLKGFAYPTIAGRQLVPGKIPAPTDSLLVPYDRAGELLPESSLGKLGAYLREGNRRSALMARTCVRRKPWYAFHENPPLRDILRPKILCKDVSREPHFFVDRGGTMVPRHSVYYIVPRDSSVLERLVSYLNGHEAREWLGQHCQRAAGDFVRLQSHVLKRLPVPDSLAHHSVHASGTPLRHLEMPPISGNPCVNAG